MAIDYNKYINSKGTHYISNSGSDENRGYHGGKAGDQTGHEWELRSWYNRPWSHVLRHPDPKVRRLMAEYGIEAALNDLNGYDQYERTTFWRALEAAVGYRPANITKACEADCTAGVAAIVKAIGFVLKIAKLQGVSINAYSGNLRSILKAAGFEVLTASKYLTGHAYLLPGDVLLYEDHHAAINITRGSKATGEVADHVDTGNIDPDELRNGSTGAAVKDLQTRLIALGYGCGPDGADGDFGPNTEAALKQFQAAKGLPQTGIYDAATRAAMTGEDSGAPQQTPIDPGPSQQPVPRAVIHDCKSAYIRTGPGQQYPDVGDCGPGDTFQAVDTAAWVPVLINGQVRWVSGKYARLEG